jgi:hypothetical protein
MKRLHFPLCVVASISSPFVFAADRPLLCSPPVIGSDASGVNGIDGVSGIICDVAVDSITIEKVVFNRGRCIEPNTTISAAIAIMLSRLSICKKVDAFGYHPGDPLHVCQKSAETLRKSKLPRKAEFGDRIWLATTESCNILEYRITADGKEWIYWAK